MDVPFGSRLLSIGEVFDTAINVVLRNILPLFIAYGATALPLRILVDWIQRAQDQRFWSAIAAVVAKPSLMSQFNTMVAGRNTSTQPAMWLLIAANVFGSLLAGCVIALLTRGFLRSEPPTFRSAIGPALRRSPRVLGQSIVSIVIGFSIAIAAMLLWFVPLVIVSMVAGPKSVADSVYIVFIVGALVSLAALFALVQPWTLCAFGAIALDDMGIWQALGSAWRLTMGRRAIARSLGFGIALLACMLAGGLAALSALALATLSHQYAIGVAVRDLLDVLISIFLYSASIVFYLDAKARDAIFQDATLNRENSAAR